VLSALYPIAEIAKTLLPKGSTVAEDDAPEDEDPDEDEVEEKDEEEEEEEQEEEEEESPL